MGNFLYFISLGLFLATPGAQSAVIPGLIDTFTNIITGTVNVLNDAGLDTSVLQNDPFIVADPVDIIKMSDYPSVKSVNVTTEDGYILTLWRIKCPRYQKTCDQGTPVLLQHGLLLTGADWLFVDRDSVLPFYLADQGMDVYIGNARGNRYSKAHVNKSTGRTSDYWHFGVDDMGTKDLPAVIDHIIEKTGKPQIRYIGYSMGTTMFFILMSERGEDYRGKIESAVALAPAAFIDHLSAPLNVLGTTSRLGVTSLVATLASKLVEGKEGPIPDSTSLTGPLAEATQVLGLISSLGKIKNLVDGPLQIALAEASVPITNPTAFRRALGHAPGGGSLRTVAHYVQLFKFKSFRRFQFADPIENSKKYKGKVNPGDYALANYETVPLFVLAGTKDSLVVPSDAYKTALAFADGPGLVAYCRMVNFNHMDFVYGPNDRLKRMNEYIVKYFNTSPDDFAIKDNCPDYKFKGKASIEGEQLGEEKGESLNSESFDYY